MFVETAKKESLKDKDYSTEMQAMVVCFFYVHLQVFLYPSKFDSQHFFCKLGTFIMQK